MSHRAAVILAGALGALVLLTWARSRALDSALDAAADAPDAGDAGSSWSSDLIDTADSFNPWQIVTQSQTDTAAADSNVIAFERVIGYAEGTDREANPYAVCYGYAHTIRDFSDHPAVTGEWTGGKITSGVYAGRTSTAAGRYQINAPTWRDAKRALGLVDFSPVSQDRAAVWLMKRAGGLDAVQRGDFAGAVAACSSCWASLPGSSAGQGTRRFADLEATYAAAGGAFA